MDRTQGGGCPFSGSKKSDPRSVAQNESPIQSVREQMAEMLLSYSRVNLSQEIFSLKKNPEVALGKVIDAEHPEAHLPRVNSIIAIFLESMYPSFKSWRDQISKNEHDVPIIMRDERGAPIGACSLSYIRGVIGRETSIEGRIQALISRLESTAIAFFGEKRVLVSEQSRDAIVLLDGYVDAPKFERYAVAGMDEQHLNAIIVAGFMTGISVLSKFALVSFQLLREYKGEAITYEEFQRCFMQSQDFAIDMMRIPLALAEHLDRRLGAATAGSEVQMELYDRGYFAIVGGQQGHLVGLRRGVVAEIAGLEPNGMSPESGRAGVGIYTKCPALYVSADNTPIVTDLARWICETTWKAVFSQEG